MSRLDFNNDEVLDFFFFLFFKTLIYTHFPLRFDLEKNQFKCQKHSVEHYLIRVAQKVKNILKFIWKVAKHIIWVIWVDINLLSCTIFTRNRQNLYKTLIKFLFFPIAALWNSCQCNVIQQIKNM